MNILYLSDVSLDIIGGAQESMKVVMDGLADRYNFSIITPCNDKQYKYNVSELTGYKNLSLRGKGILDIIKIIRRIKKIIENNKIDIIHVQMPATMLLIGIMKNLRMIDNNIIIIYTDRGVLNKYGKKTYYGIKKFSKYFSKIILTTNYNMNLYRNYINIKEEKLSLINNTAGNMFEKYYPEIRENRRNELNFTKDDTVIMFAGRMNKDKNWPLALEIIRDISKIKNTKIIVALGSNKTNKNIQECMELIKEASAYTGEENLRGFIDIPLIKMNELYYSSDIFILTSKVESFGRTAIEAMSRKNAVFGTNVDGLKEVIGFSDNIYEQKKEVLDKIKKIIYNKELLESEKEKFYLRFKENFGLEKNLQLHDELYDFFR
ncbi:MAG: glycosyltransferase family 4 protein [Clostridium paraputrificum]|uniref:glycosyltransferase family 4 protein n=1 Tax=Clostridium paraputrificum TaxID=29363 RepID=UPI000C06896F|nr:glycosyltransferase family 4 protein [Clostridium paraputrificum]MDB2084887.1 glycosyltransferase family 4 protein [Clostridium paraputrificum]SQB86128.1 group 1 glycosyl transferase [Clostridium paraputrificum]